MSFDDAYRRRFDEVLRPAIEQDINYQGERLTAHRVDLSKSGDSILSDIADGVAHSVMVLADVSVVGRDAVSGQGYRNANVLYEVGMALACRQSSEVLLLRDDSDKFLFDVSTVPHMNLNFTDAPSARKKLANELQNRLREIDLVYDARVKVAVASMTGQERQVIAAFSKYGMNKIFWITEENMGTLAAIPRLLDKQLIVAVGLTHDLHGKYRWTRLGKALADRIDELLPRAEPEGSKPLSTARD